MTGVERVSAVDVNRLAQKFYESAGLAMLMVDKPKIAKGLTAVLAELGITVMPPLPKEIGAVISNVVTTSGVQYRRGVRVDEARWILVRQTGFSNRPEDEIASFEPGIVKPLEAF